MVVRKTRKTKKKRGSRTVGGGTVKKRRHSGHKGGKGLAGSHKHRWMKLTKKAPKHFGKHGFTRPPKLQKSVSTINVGELDERIDELLETEAAEQKEGKTIVDVTKIGIDKVLGRGKISRSMKVIAKNFSKSAKEKLEEAGGEVTTGEV
ncbi:50S ribosomal protein L15 [candidate division MSBL1 archaeon SCGC-AAA261F19]|uniref:Large ribosomal subunit protein uL15 n=7 Tax=candidate division MSBL1 TaxID=215777 RepID=A0A133VSG9_9EURY|nr:50S ribosomal protein L15 [candidate division MSBL1 archaeon SCGC-AAA261F17]KXB02559.1 50S ribosomal protein L15 [candidate division MSBL1 archaeon SCGC-AAA261D19]KXB03031.1 50S ribosomal protein L15 [candidate division MSBL1 archaeon SCGC-AAA261F19]KXB04481.1 50S ribosomal protein L15 [candidate division MSBL1 archaeon SCGC-AAA261O19]KXB09376.1 50S ribosomal protein L15 [candidate division MSBL1 archaeon SCGC-AAA833K04]